MVIKAQHKITTNKYQSYYLHFPFKNPTTSEQEPKILSDVIARLRGEDRKT